jgi:hypothetical protein
VNIIPDEDEGFVNNNGFSNNPNDYDIDETEEEGKIGLMTKLVILLLVLALLSTLMWPLLRTGYRRYPTTPTPTPLFLQEV